MPPDPAICYHLDVFSSIDHLSYFSRRNVAIWLALAFQGGTINAGGFLACGRFVSHVTGFATMSGAELARQHWFGAVGMLSVPIFFVFGAMTSGFLIDRRLLRGLNAHYATAAGLMAATNLAILILGTRGAFGAFGEPLTLARDYALLILLCFSSGLQNALVTSASGAVVRTTHLTGLTTDLGIGLVRILSHVDRDKRRFETRANRMRIGIFASFTLGSAAAAFIFLTHQYWGFVIPATISMGLWGLTFAHSRRRWAQNRRWGAAQ